MTKNLKPGAGIFVLNPSAGKIASYSAHLRSTCYVCIYRLKVASCDFPLNLWRCSHSGWHSKCEYLIHFPRVPFTVCVLTIVWWILRFTALPKKGPGCTGLTGQAEPLCVRETTLLSQSMSSVTRPQAEGSFSVVVAVCGCRDRSVSLPKENMSSCDVVQCTYHASVKSALSFS